MKVALTLAVAAVASFLTTAAAADDESEIRAEIRSYLEAWNAGNAERLASFYLEDGDRANNRGDLFRGRAAIHDHYAQVFANPPPEGIDRRLSYEQVDVRVVLPEAAVVDIRYVVSGISAEVDRSVRGRNSVFMVKHEGRWMRAAHRNSLPISPACLTLCSERNLLPWQRGE